MSGKWEFSGKLSERVKKDPNIVMTKPEMAEHLISLIKFKKNDIVLEPCRGNGAFFNNFPNHTINKWCEINEGKDFFDFDEKVDFCIANCPFVPRKLFWRFHQHAMDITNKEIYWLINFSSLNTFTPKRLNEMKEKGWFINKFHIVADKRWYGRYVFLKISKKDNKIFSWNEKTF